jgi:hypothetical protein
VLDIRAELDRRHRARVEATQQDWDDESADAAVAGNVRRSFYISHMAGRLPEIVAGCIARGEALAAHRQAEDAWVEEQRAAASQIDLGALRG